jgi:hypothetical protein
MIELNLNPSRKELRLFAVLQVVFFAVVATIVYRRTGSTALAAWIVAVSAGAGLVGYWQPAFMRVIYVVWMTAVFPIGWVVSHLIMAALFYLLITPIGLVMRLCGHDPMQRAFDPNATTYWRRRPENQGVRRYFRQY